MATRKKASKTKRKTAKHSPRRPKSKKKAGPRPKKKAQPKPRKKTKPAKKTKPPPKTKGQKVVTPKKTKTKPAPKSKPAPAPKEIGEFSLETKIQRQKDVAWRMIDGEAVIITPSDSTMHTLNDVGTRIWELMTGTRTLREVAGVLCAEFEVDLERAEKDTLWFAECLAKKGLIEHP